MHPFMIGKFTVGTNHWLYRSMGLLVLGVAGIFPFSSFVSERKTKEERGGMGD
jgi:hypothetical protein